MTISYKDYKLRFCCLKIIVLLLIFRIHANASDPLLTMADSLMSSGFYDSAITEYYRYLFFNPNSRLLDDTYSKIGYCYAYLEKWNKAVKTMDESILFAENDSLLYQRKIDRAIILLVSNNIDEAKFDLKQIACFSIHEDTRNRATMLLFLSAIFSHDWKVALNIYRSLIKSKYLVPDSIESILIKASNINYKSPITAMFLSTLIPGVGQIYSGKWLSGLNTMSLNGALGYLTVNNIIKESYVSGFLVYIFLFQRYYNGNRHHAYNIAIEQNEKIDRRYEKEILNLIRKNYNLSGRIQSDSNKQR